MATRTKTNENAIDDCWKTIGVWNKGQATCPRLEQVIHCRNCEVYSRAGKSLLQRETPLHYIDEWTELLAKQNDKSVVDTTAVMIFRLGDEWIALSIGVIQEVVEMGIMHQIPHVAGDVMRGLVSIKGELHICVSVGGLLGIKKGEKWNFDDNQISYSERLIIASIHDEKYVFPVSEIRGIFRINPEEVQQPPSTLSNSMSTYMSGIFQLEVMNIGLLDEHRLFDGLARSVL